MITHEFGPWMMFTFCSSCNSHVSNHKINPKTDPCPSCGKIGVVFLDKPARRVYEIHRTIFGKERTQVSIEEKSNRT